MPTKPPIDAERLGLLARLETKIEQARLNLSVHLELPRVIPADDDEARKAAGDHALIGAGLALDLAHCANDLASHLVATGSQLYRPAPTMPRKEVPVA